MMRRSLTIIRSKSNHSTIPTPMLNKRPTYVGLFTPYSCTKIYPSILKKIIMFSGSYILDTLFLVFCISVFSFFSLAPWSPTRKIDFERINKILKLKKGEKFLDMWCGDSRVGLYLAKRNPKAHIVGIELSPILYLISKIRIWWSGLQNIEVIYGNALHQTLKKYDAIYIFWLPETIHEKVVPKLKQETKKDIRFISYSFRTTDNFFEETKHTHTNQSNIYEYRKK